MIRAKHFRTFRRGPVRILPAPQVTADRILADDKLVRLLRRARHALGRAQELHLASVKIGRMEPIADSGVIDVEIVLGRLLLESFDSLCADIDRDVPGLRDRAHG